MEKRYQIFISSTYTDLKEEREKVMYAVMRLNHIPAGMELFPAVDEEQFTYIKRVIDMSDYYILIIGGRYGSLSEEGLSYTEKEYDYAVLQKKKVIALLHKSPDKIPVGKSDITNELREKLTVFRKKIETGGKLVSYWETADELSAMAMSALVNTINLFPAEGWIRANTITNPEAYKELNEVRKELQILKEENDKYSTLIQQEDLIQKFKWVNEILCLTINYNIYSNGNLYNDAIGKGNSEIKISWSDLLLFLLPSVSSPLDEDSVYLNVNNNLRKLIDISENDKAIGNHIGSIHLDRNNFSEIKIRLMGNEIIYATLKVGKVVEEYGYVNHINDSVIWSLSPLGAKLYTQLQDARIIP